MRVFVTGGSGFIGSKVVRRLCVEGHEVVCLVRATSDTKGIDGLRVERRPGDVRDPASLHAGMAGCDATLHLAAPGGWEADAPGLLTDVIETGTRNVLESAAALPLHRVIVVSSTAAVNGSNRPELFDERSEFAVADSSLHYAHAKRRAEKLAQEAHARGVDVVTVNPSEVYGPGDTRLVTAGNLVDFATATPVLVCHGGTSVVHVDDVASGIMAALTRGRSGERYILGGENLSIRQLAELVVQLRRRRVPVVSVPNALVRGLSRAAVRWRIPLPYNPHVVPYATRYWYVDNRKATTELGVCFRSARETIASTLDWLVTVGHLTAVA